MDMLTKLRSNKGLTLLEVMVAMAVTAVSLVSLITLVVADLDVEEYARRMTSATLLAEGRLKEIERAGYPEVSQTEGPVEEAGSSEFHHRTIVTETPFADVRQVEVEIFWDKKRRSVVLAGYFAKK